MLLTVVEALFRMKQLNISGQYGKTKLVFHQYIHRVVSALIHVYGLIVNFDIKCARIAQSL